MLVLFILLIWDGDILYWLLISLEVISAFSMICLRSINWLWVSFWNLFLSENSSYMFSSSLNRLESLWSLLELSLYLPFAMNQYCQLLKLTSMQGPLILWNSYSSSLNLCWLWMVNFYLFYGLILIVLKYLAPFDIRWNSLCCFISCLHYTIKWQMLYDNQLANLTQYLLNNWDHFHTPLDKSK